MYTKSNIFIAFLFAFSLVAVVAVTVSAIMPFEPYHLNSYEVVPSSQCKGDVVSLYPERLLDEGTFDVTIDPYWQYKKTGQIVEAPAARSITIRGTGSTDYERSQLAQEVPEKAGEWTHHVEVTVNGRVGVLPRKQVIEKEAKSPITVLPNDDQRCTTGGLNGND